MKKHYIIPTIEVTKLQTARLMDLASDSNPDDGHIYGAPPRRTPAF